MRQPTTQLTERAEFCLSLARAFLPPAEPRDFRAFRDELAPTLEELGAELNYPIGRPLAQFRAAIARIADQQDLLRLYSRLFLMPPTPAHLNAGVYLDGAVMGQSALEVEAHYRRFGLVRSPEFHDAPDHLSSLLEFLALINVRTAEAQEAKDDAMAGILLHEAGSFACDYVASWLPALCRDLDGATGDGATGVYAALAEVLRSAVTHDYARVAAASIPVDQPASSAADQPARQTSEQLRCRSCGTAFIATEEMHDILLVLGRAGLGTEHLELCPDCRTRSMGLTGMTPPGLRHLRH